MKFFKLFKYLIYVQYAIVFFNNSIVLSAVAHKSLPTWEHRGREMHVGPICSVAVYKQFKGCVIAGFAGRIKYVIIPLVSCIATLFRRKVNLQHLNMQQFLRSGRYKENNFDLIDYSHFTCSHQSIGQSRHS